VTLAKAKLICHTTELCQDALQMAEAYDYDIILLDLTRPDIEDYEVLRRLRAAGVPTPILILSDRADPDYKIKGFGLGADDFLTKPFDAGELVARIRAIVRRSKGHSGSVIRTGKLVVNHDTRVATVDGRPLRLTGKEYGILELLSLHKGTTLTKEMLLNHLYGGMDEPKPELRIIDVFVCKLRKKLARENGGRHYIETAYGLGYVLRDPPPVPAATLAVTLEGLDGRHDEPATRAAEERTVGRAHLPLSQTASPLSQIERRLARGPEDVRDHRVGRCRAPGIRHRPEVRSISSPVEMRFEDAVTKDGGPFHLPRPEPARSPYGCATARCHE
jgi:two-component system, cell cycle response regulator CtrA